MLIISVMQGDAENLGTTVSYNTAVIGGHVGYEGLELHICESKELQNHHGGSPVTPQLVLLPKLLINSAGWVFGTWLLWDPTKTFWSWTTSFRFCHSGAGYPCYSWAG